MATTLALAEQNHAEELKRVCLEFVSKNLSVVMTSEGYQHMVSSCPQLQVLAPTSPVLVAEGLHDVAVMLSTCCAVCRSVRSQLGPAAGWSCSVT